MSPVNAAEGERIVTPKLVEQPVREETYENRTEVTPEVGLTERPETLERSVDSGERTERRKAMKRKGTGAGDIPNKQMRLMLQMINRTVGTLSVKLNELNKKVEENSLSKVVVRQQDANQPRTSTIIGDLVIRNEAQTPNSSSTITRSDNTTPNGSNQIPTQTDTVMSNGERKEVVYHIRNINSERPKFSNKSSGHPMTFLEDIANYIRRSAKEGSELELILECLQGEALDWSRVYKERWSTVEDFKADFLATFWGENEQSELRRQIIQGGCPRKNSSTMLSHFLSITGQARMLTYKIPEKQLISDVIRHFPKFVQQAWVTKRTDNLIETAEFLRSLDDIMRQEPHIYTPSVQPRFSEKKKELQQNYNNWQRPVAAKRVMEKTPTAVNVTSRDDPAATKTLV